ncbi:MAG: hypothetical protein ACI4GC_06615 [Acutalibacteraceae bacterium]
MKKAMYILVCFLALLSLSCCGKEAVTSGNITDGNLPSTEFVGTDIVSITMHLSKLDKKYYDDTSAYCEINGFKSCTVDKENSLFTVTMEKSRHKFFLYEVGRTVVKNISDFIDSDTFPYFKNFKDYNEDFSRISLYVDKEGYNEDKMHSTLLYYVGECCMFYQNYTEKNEYSCKITVIDQTSGEIIDARSYRQDNTGNPPAEETANG